MGTQILGEYSDDVKARVRGLYDFCYGLSREAERVLNEENPRNDIKSQSIDKYWESLDLEPKSRNFFIREHVKKGYKRCHGWIDKIEEYLLEVTTTIVDGKKKVRVYTGVNTVKDTARALCLKLKYPESRKKGGKKGVGARKLTSLEPKLSDAERYRRKWLLPPEMVAR